MSKDALLVLCGDAAEPPGTELPVARIAANPTKSELDPLLAELRGDRLIVAGRDGDLAAVALRLLRTDRLGAIALGYVPSESCSAVAALWQLPVQADRALELARAGKPDRVPLIRDDGGGVLLGRGVIAPIDGVAYCDDDRVLGGKATALAVWPHRHRGLETTVTVRRLLGRRRRRSQGRALQIGCESSHPVLDGVRYPRPVTKWTWYRHTEDLRLIRAVG